MADVKCSSIGKVTWSASAAASFVISASADIWRIKITHSIARSGQLIHLLSQDERERSGSYHYANDKHRFILSRVFLRLLLSRYINIPAGNIRFTTDNSHKPFVQNSPDLYYNISHSGDYVIIAIARSPVGLDIEFIDANFAFSDLLREHFSQAEIQYIQANQRPLTAFYLLWTRKEALLKATGKGMDNNLWHVPSLDGVSCVAAEFIGSDKNWFVSSFEIDDDYKSSIAICSSDNTLRFYDGEDVLVAKT